MIGPEDMPCPDCGDGRKPRYTYCTACAKARGLLNSDGTIDAMCPTNRCSCGLTKAIAYSRCTICEANLREGLQEVRTENYTENCERCIRPVNAAKRFCRRCMVEMGAPQSAYDDEFNDRRKHYGMSTNSQAPVADTRRSSLSH